RRVGEGSGGGGHPHRVAQGPVVPGVALRAAQPDTAVFDAVRKSLQLSQTVGWDHAHISIDLAIELFDTEEGQVFLSGYLHQITSIMLDQQISKMGGFERGCVMKSLESSCNALQRLLAAGRADHLETLVQLFNTQRSYYRGIKSMWNNLPGAPEQRVLRCRQFMENGGFAALVKVMESQTYRLKRNVQHRNAQKAAQEKAGVGPGAGAGAGG
ncbi:unnamed protein product, partial [Discosporangium mesarthrocarpum]